MSALYHNEAQARVVIDRMLGDAGWNVADRSQVLLEERVPIVRHEDVSPIIVRSDYVLLDQRGRPLAVIEAKRDALDPYSAKQQTLPYAKTLDAPFIFLSNGEVTYFWDWKKGDARIVNSFYSKDDLLRILNIRENEKPLATVEIPNHYLRSGDSRKLRPYQQDAMRALDHALEIGKRRFLLELPTGTGKTDLTCLHIKRMFEADRWKRVLILVDREELAKQALDAIQDLLPAQSSYWLKAGMKPQPGIEITVCLLQTMISQYESFTSGFFDSVVVDESHRSIYGSWQIALTHFDAFHLGLTATPAAFIDRNTYRFYHCKDRKPDFSYPIDEAINNDFLCGWRFAEGCTEFIGEGVEKDETFYDPAEFERKWTNEDTNRKMMAKFDELAHKNALDSAPGLPEGAMPGKAIVFAISKHHAARLARYLNELHPEAKGAYAEVITSDVRDADVLIRKFKREAFPKVAVSVDMLTTGFDAPEVLHIVLCRRIGSRILYEQIRGRGTRTAPRIGKREFVIYDFFRNKELHEDADINDGGTVGTGGGKSRSTTVPANLAELALEDRWLHAVHYVEVGPDGERFDKKDYVSEWEDIVRAQIADDTILQKIRDGAALTEDEETRLTDNLNRPSHYFNEENLRLAYEHEGTIIEFIREALGLIKSKTREEQLEENFRAWLVSKDFSPTQASYLTGLKNRGVVRGSVALDDLFRPPLSIVNAAGVGVELFGEAGLKNVIEELNDSVFPVHSKSA